MVSEQEKQQRVETFPGFLGEEADEVARRMALFREELLHRLLDRPAPLRNPAPPRESVNLPRKQGGSGFSPFYYYPFLFASAFPSVAAEDLRTLAFANRILLEAILLSDKKIDETRPWTPVDFYLADCCFHKASETLLSLFPLEHTFWLQTQNWFSQYARAIHKEQLRHRYRLSRYTLEEFYEISKGKVALLKTTLLAMGLLSDDADVASLMESQDRFLVGFQCFDDLKDWKEDLRHKNFTFLLTRVLLEGGFDHRLRRNGFLPRGEVGQVLYHRGIAEDQLRLAERYFREALDSVKAVHVPLWVDVIRGFLRHCRTMRHDLAEIRRRARTANDARGVTQEAAVRAARGIPPEAVAVRLKEALLFLTRSQDPLGGYPLARSPHPYMNPSTPLAPSRLVTSFLLRALAPLKDLAALLPPLLFKASQWLDRPPRETEHPRLPIPLEKSFPPGRVNRAEWLEFDESFDAALPLLPHGLFWANLLYTASTANLRLEKLQSRVEDCVRQADYAPWTLCFSLNGSNATRAHGACRSLLPLLLFCQASGSELPRKPLHDYLLRRYRTEKSWNHPTETALSLLCLLATDYQGPELPSAVDRLIRSQERDGSWPPNAFYEQDGLFYGSRELTTAWCLTALFLYHLRPCLHDEHKSAVPNVKQGAPNPSVVVHAGLPGNLSVLTASALEQLRNVLNPSWPHTIYVGRWPAMPPHFLLDTEEGMILGVNIRGKGHHPVLSAGRRPLNVEIAMGVMSAHRCRLLGALKDRLERIFVAGVALRACATIWPREAPWVRLGMRKLDWAWCREHEPFLWEELRRFLLHPDPKQSCFQWLLPDPPPSPGRLIPKGASLFLGEGLFRQTEPPEDAADPCRQASDLLCTDLPDILRTFRRKVGLEGHENTFS